MRGGGQGQPGAGCLRAENEKIESAIVDKVGLKPIDDLLTPPDRRSAVNDFDLCQAKFLSNNLREAKLDIAMLNEHERAFTG